MATRHNKDPHISMETGEQRTDQAAQRGKPMKPGDAVCKSMDHSQKSKCKKLDEKGFKDVA